MATFSINFLQIVRDRNGGFNNAIHAKAYDFIFNFERNLYWMKGNKWSLTQFSWKTHCAAFDKQSDKYL